MLFDDSYNILEVLDYVGFNFVPIDTTPRKNVVRSSYDKTITESFRKLQWKWIMRDKPGELWKPRPFGFIPSTKHPMIKDEFASVFFREKSTQVRHDVHTQLQAELEQWYNNDKRFQYLSKQAIAEKIERSVAKGDLIIESDKNMGLFIITRLQYDNMMQREISNYERSEYGEGDILDKQLVEMNTLLSFFRNADKEAYDYITRWWEQNPETMKKLPTLRPLVKVGKLQGDFSRRDLTKVVVELPYRPILSYCGSLLHPVSQVMSEVFNKIVKSLYPWVLQDTDSFVRWFHGNKTPGAQLHTADATNLYGSIPPQAMINEIRIWIDEPMIVQWFAQNEHYWMIQQRVHGIPFVLVALERLLTNTYLAHEGMVLRQHKGHPMGAGIVPPLANLLLAIYEERAYGREPPLRRYLDDIATFNKETLVNYKNVYPDYIILNLEFNSKKFLDVEIRNGETFVHVKKYATLPPHVDSNVPMSFKKNYFTTQLCRMKKICSTTEGIEEFLLFLYEGAIKRGYTINFVRKIVNTYDWQKEEIQKKTQITKHTTFVVQKVFSSIDVDIARTIDLRWNSTTPPLLEQNFMRSRKLDTSSKNICQKLRQRFPQK